MLAAADADAAVCMHVFRNTLSPPALLTLCAVTEVLLLPLLLLLLCHCVGMSLGP
jgi:hypothetical protein